MTASMLPYYVNENEKTKTNVKYKMKFGKPKKKEKNCSGDIMDRYLSLKCGVNPLDRFRGNDVYGRTDGRRPPTS